MDLSRRTVIGAGVALPVVAAAPPAVAAPTVTGPSPADWADLARTLKGTVALPGSSTYSGGIKLFDPHWDYLRPAALARIRLRADIAACITFAHDHGLRVTARSGGHSYVGASANTGLLVIDTRAYADRFISTDHSLVTVRGGSDLYSVHEFLAARGRSLPTGTCPTVGASGLTLSGGLGVDSRRYGLTADRLVRAVVVDGRGRILTVDKDRHPDLFWSLKGGGSGTVVAADLTYATIPARSFGFFNVTFPSSSLAHVVRVWAEWMAAQPRDTWANVHLDTSGSSVTVRVFGVTPVGLEASRARSLTRAVAVTPLRTMTTTRTHLAGIQYLGGGTTTPRTRFTAGSDILRTVTGSGAHAVEDAIRSAAARGLSASAILDPLDGAVADPAISSTAFPWRAHAASIQWYVGLSSSSSSAYWAARSWISHAHDVLAPWSRGAYLGYLESGRQLLSYLSVNADRRNSVRDTYDPDNVIR